MMQNMRDGVLFGVFTPRASSPLAVYQPSQALFFLRTHFPSFSFWQLSTSCLYSTLQLKDILQMYLLCFFFDAPPPSCKLYLREDLLHMAAGQLHRVPHC